MNATVPFYSASIVRGVQFNPDGPHYTTIGDLCKRFSISRSSVTTAVKKLGCELHKVETKEEYARCLQVWTGLRNLERLKPPIVLQMVRLTPELRACVQCGVLHTARSKRNPATATAATNGEVVVSTPPGDEAPTGDRMVELMRMPAGMDSSVVSATESNDNDDDPLENAQRPSRHGVRPHASLTMGAPLPVVLGKMWDRARERGELQELFRAGHIVADPNHTTVQELMQHPQLPLILSCYDRFGRDDHVRASDVRKRARVAFDGLQ